MWEAIALSKAMTRWQRNTVVPWDGVLWDGKDEFCGGVDRLTMKLRRWKEGRGQKLDQERSRVMGGQSMKSLCSS